MFDHLGCLLVLLVSIASFTLADVKFTSPSAGATITGGKTLNVQWKDSGDKPAISDLTTYQLFLCAGGDTDATSAQLAVLAAQGDFSTGNAASGTVQLGIGGTDKNAYYLKMISVSPGAGTIINFSDRFSISGMTGTFPANVAAAVKTISGTSGPATVNNIAAVPAAGAAGAGSFGQPYSLQTGPIKYAPMQKKPGSKITAKGASMMYPTSAVNLARTALPPPVQVTTMTASPTYALGQSVENTASPLPGPAQAMQKYLNRWRD